MAYMRAVTALEIYRHLASPADRHMTVMTVTAVMVVMMTLDFHLTTKVAVQFYHVSTDRATISLNGILPSRAKLHSLIVQSMRARYYMKSIMLLLRTSL